MLLSETNTHQPNSRKRTLARPIQLGTVSLKFVFIGLLAAVALLYLAQSTQSATRANEFRLLEVEKKSLEHDRERLEIEANRLRSLEVIQEHVIEPSPPADQPVSWEPVQEVTYLSGPAAVAEQR